MCSRRNQAWLCIDGRAILEAGQLRSVDEFYIVRANFGPNTDQQLVNRLERAWREATEIGPRELAAALKSSTATSELAGSRGSIGLVWTGPSTGLVPVRPTEQVLCEVIDSARYRLFLVSFVAYEVKSITRALRGAVGREVEVDVLLESSTAHGGSVSFDSVKAMKETVPSANVFVWKQDRADTGSGWAKRAVHSKCAVADGELAFITSANLSAAAMERNMELGVLISGGSLPDNLYRHLDVLVTTGIIETVSMDTVCKAARSRIMASVPQRDTRPEMRLHRASHRLGLRYRLHDRKLPGSPDLVFPRFHAIVFVHGCFWHAHGCKYSTMPSTRREFWEEKFATNKARDKRNVDLLLADGWRVLTVWECALKGKRSHHEEALARRVAKWLRGTRKQLEIGGSPDSV